MMPNMMQELDIVVNHQQHAMEGRQLLSEGKPAKAMQAYIQALLCAPSNRRYKAEFVQCIPNVKFSQFSPDAQKVMQICLDDTHIAHRKLSLGWIQQIQLDPKMQSLFKFLDCESYEVFEQDFDPADVLPALNDRFFCSGLKKCLLMNVFFERLLTFLRRFYFMKATASQKLSALPFLCALAQKCFFNEYAFYYAVEEEKQIEDYLKRQILSTEEAVLLGSYRALHHWPAAAQFAVEDDEDVKEFIKLQITNPFKEKDIIKEIESFSSIDDEISNQVQSQYEENPYPRWANISVLELSEGKQEKSKGRDVLIAGCGTGQEPVSIASRLQKANIDAIDLSRVSLAYAIRQSEEIGVKNVNFKHGDLLQVEKLNKKYDLIFSSGVLHHMDNPKAGLQALKNILKPDGVISIALYSELARRSIVPVQQWIKEQGYSTKTEDIRRFRQDIFSLPKGHVMKQALLISDFYNISECRDLLFHVKEHRFTCLTIQEMLEELDLDLIDMSVRVPRLKDQYRQQYPKDTHCVNLNNWHHFEQENPNMFFSMYGLLLAPKGQRDAGHIPDWLDGMGVFVK